LVKEKGHNISQLAAKLSTLAGHIANKAEPDYSLGFTVSKDIQFRCDHDSDVEAEALLLAKQKLAAKTKRRQSVHEQMLAAELDSIRDENKELKAGIQTADDKLNRKDRQKLPLLTMKAELGYKLQVG
jgi:hypothetical protein